MSDDEFLVIAGWMGAGECKGRARRSALIGLTMAALALISNSEAASRDSDIEPSNPAIKIPRAANPAAAAALAKGETAFNAGDYGRLR